MDPASTCCHIYIRAEPLLPLPLLCWFSAGGIAVLNLCKEIYIKYQSVKR
jgi:hypothetical protein